MMSSVAGGWAAGLGAVTALGMAAGSYAYAAMVPSSRVFGPAEIAPSRPAELALTFDDGPNPAWTPQLLDMLAEHDVRATFFLIGRFAAAEPLLTRRMADAGHLIGNHSWSHPNLAFATPARVREELTHAKETLEQITGKPVHYFRPPFGARRPDVLSCSRQLGMSPVLWNAMTTDWSEPSVDKISTRLIDRIDANQRQGNASNIVLHDGGHAGLGADRGPSVAAATRLVARYVNTRKFVTLAQWNQPQVPQP